MAISWRLNAVVHYAESDVANSSITCDIDEHHSASVASSSARTDVGSSSTLDDGAPMLTPRQAIVRDLCTTCCNFFDMASEHWSVFDMEILKTALERVARSNAVLQRIDQQWEDVSPSKYHRKPKSRDNKQMGSWAEARNALEHLSKEMMKHQQMVQEVADPFHVLRAVVTQIPERGAKVQHLPSKCRWVIEGYATCLDQLAKHKHKLILQHQHRNSAKADARRELSFIVGGGLLRTWEERVDLVHFGGNDAECNINEIFPSLMDTYLILRCNDGMNICKFDPTRDYEGCHSQHARERILQTIIDLYPVVVLKRGTGFQVVVCNSEMIDLALAAFAENEGSSSPRGGGLVQVRDVHGLKRSIRTWYLFQPDYLAFLGHKGLKVGDKTISGGQSV